MRGVFGLAPLFPGGPGGTKLLLFTTHKLSQMCKKKALGNVDCIPGTQVPRGFYLMGFKLNYSPTLESENWTQDRQLTLPVGSLACPQRLQKLVCAVRGFASWQSQ
jgi:hypothetical protein